MLLGITGNMGSGKSTVLAAFKELGLGAISADEIVHRLLQTPPVKEKITAALGDILDEKGNADKAKIAHIVFNNNKLRLLLEEILHPMVMNEIRLFAMSHQGVAAVAEIPLLFEGGYEKEVDVIITVTTEREVAVNRLLEKGLSKEEIDRRLAAQIPDEYKKAASHFIVDNSGTEAETQNQVRDIWTSLK